MSAPTAGGPPFEGFVAFGATTRVPSQFFAELLPAIDDEAELRVTLYALYAIGRRRRPPRAVRASELAVEAPLRAALDGCGGDAALRPALERAVARGSLLALRLDDGDTLCFVNNEEGRRAFDRVRSGVSPLPDGARTAAARVEPVAASAPVRVYEQAFGLFTPAASEWLAEACERYPEEWVTDALRRAARNNVRSWAYVEGFLRRWANEGRDEGTGSARRTGARGADVVAPRHYGEDEHLIVRSEADYERIHGARERARREARSRQQGAEKRD